MISNRAETPTTANRGPRSRGGWKETKLFETTDKVRLAYRDNGLEGPPLVMLHGWGQSGEAFRHQLEGLDCHVVTLDFRGHGRSDKPEFGYRIARLARDVGEFLSHLGSPLVDLLGWSMGASVVWSYIDLAGTGRVRKLVLVDEPAALVSAPWRPMAQNVAMGVAFTQRELFEFLGALAGPEGSVVRDAFVRGMLSEDVSPEVRTLVEHESRLIPLSVAVPLLMDHCSQEWTDVLERIDVETLVIGCESSIVSALSQEYVARQIPGAKLEILPAAVGRSHFAFLESPDMFNGLLRRFLRGR